MARTNIIDKIQLLLNKAENNTNEHEAEMCYNAAMKLMQRHAIEESQLPGNSTKEAIIKVVVEVKKRDEIRSAKSLLLSGLARANRCRIVIATNRGVGEVWIFGYESDANFVHMLYLSVMLQYATERNHGWKAYKGAESRYLWVNSFAQGFAQRVSRRLQDMSTESAKEAGTEMVLFDRSRDVEDWMSSNLSLGKGRAVKARYGTGYYQGSDAGDRTNLSGGRNNLPGRKTLGA